MKCADVNVAPGRREAEAGATNKDHAMTLDQSYLRIVRDQRPQLAAEQKINELQADLVHAARLWAMDEMGAAIAHELNDPLTALLLYLQTIEQASRWQTEAGMVPTSLQDMLQKAIHEAERACNIIERMRHVSEKPADPLSAVWRGREAIDAWTRLREKGAGHARASPMPRHHTLTPREREVLAQITAGTSNKEGSQHLGISTRTFEVHRAHIMEKLGAKNAADLVRIVLSEPENA